MPFQCPDIIFETLQMQEIYAFVTFKRNSGYLKVKWGQRATLARKIKETLNEHAVVCVFWYFCLTYGVMKVQQCHYYKKCTVNTCWNEIRCFSFRFKTLILAQFLFIN